jgi:hypothetical protein
MIIRFTSFLQAFSWTIVLVVLFFMDRGSASGSLCLFRFLGLENCPGCGIGHSISEALHFNFSKSFEAHIMGLPATFFLILFIIRTFISSIKQSTHGPENAHDVAKSSA